MKRLCFLALFAISVLNQAVAADIVDTAVSTGKFKTLAAALGAADLVDTLKSAGPFTVFAPTDEAFAKLPASTIESLLKPENKAQLTAILTYHVVPGAVTADQVVNLTNATTVNGQRVDISTENGVMIDQATVTQTDILCDNGVIHVIDSVILPADKNLVETAQAAGSFGTLLTAATAAGLADALTGPGPFTVLAPTDEAFGKIPASTIESLLLPENKNQLAEILKYHVIQGRVYANQALQATTASTLQGNSVRFDIGSQGANVNNAKLTALDIEASNGVIHVIDTVIMPPVAKTVSAKAMPSSAGQSHSSPRQVIRDAVASGSAMFNSGHHQACADLYKQTMNDLMGMSVNSSVRSHMSSVLTSAKHCSSSTDCAWVLRKGLDQAYNQLGH